MTNADRIRAMTDDELVDFFEDMIWPECVACPAECDMWQPTEVCKQALLDWLRQEVSDDG